MSHRLPIRALYLLTAALCLWLGAAAETRAQEFRATHPLDALTPVEIGLAVNILKSAGHVTDTTRFPTITLKEPPKAEVLAWKQGEPFTREALVILRDKAKTYEAIIDLSNGKLETLEEKPGAQPSIMQEEWDLARKLTREDSRWQAAMKRRGFDNLDAISCTPLPGGFFPSEPYAGKRIMKVPCYSNADRLDAAIARPVEGVVAVVDVDDGKVLAVNDTGTPVPLPPAPQGYGATTPGPDEPQYPVVNQPVYGRNFKITGAYEVTWNRWSFHLRPDRRVGAILSLARFDDGIENRLVAYQIALSEMIVPYMDPEPGWAMRNFMDVGEFGLGYLISSLKPGVDCPEQAVFINLLMPGDKGGVFQAGNAFCIFERYNGNPAWRHYDVDTQLVNGRPETELVVRMIPTIGNYDYVVDYIFQPRGNIVIRVGATGFDAVKSVAADTMDAATAEQDTRYGALIAPYTVAPYHDHYFNFRIDLDVDGPANNFIEDRFVLVRPEDDSLRKGLWRLRSEVKDVEGGFSTHNSDGPAIWRVENRNRKTGLRYHPSYELEAGHTNETILPADDPAYLRAGFMARTLWVTRYKPDELWAAGAYSNLAADTGIPKYLEQPENIDNADLVLWYTVGFRHITRPEDYPVLPTRWHQFQLRPVHFFDRDFSARINPQTKTAP